MPRRCESRRIVETVGAGDALQRSPGSSRTRGEDLGAEQFDAVQEVGVEQAVDVGLEDLAVVAELLVEVEDAVGDLFGSAGEDHGPGRSSRARSVGAGIDRLISAEPVWDMRTSCSR